MCEGDAVTFLIAFEMADGFFGENAGVNFVRATVLKLLNAARSEV